MGLVLDLQSEALKLDCDVLNLVTKAYVVAKKLRIDDIQDWLDQELNGYRDKKKVPIYRVVCPYLKYYNPYHGWQSVVIGDEALEKTFQRFPVCDCLANLNAILNSNESNFCYPADDSMNEMLSQLARMPVTMKFAFFIPRNVIMVILEQVKRIVLEWALKLEEAGVVGDGLAFSSDEKDVAKHITYNNICIYGNVENSQLQQDTVSSLQSI